MRRIFLCVLVALSIVPVGASAQDQMLAEFKFKQLQFQVYPEGLENPQESDGKGSGLTVHVDRVVVVDFDSVDLRHCIDADSSWCTYQIPCSGSGCGDGTVTQAELDNFQQFAITGLRLAVPKVNELMKTLQSNITMDGKSGKRVALTKVTFDNALGTTDTNATIYAYIDAKVTYENDPHAKSHTIHIGNLQMKTEGFEYDAVVWKLSSDAWKFDAAATKPDAAKARVNALGYYSTQEQFEGLSANGFDMSVNQGAAKKKSPGLEVPVILGVVALLGVALRRRME